MWQRLAHIGGVDDVMQVETFFIMIAAAAVFTLWKGKLIECLCTAGVLAALTAFEVWQAPDYWWWLAAAGVLLTSANCARALYLRSRPPSI